MKENYKKYITICEIFGREPLPLCEFINISNKQFSKGLKKYGTTLEDAKLSNEVLLNHATEEIIDLIEYFKYMTNGK